MSTVREAVQARPRIELPGLEAVDDLDREALVELVTRTAALNARGLARLAVMKGDSAVSDEYLTPPEAARLLRVSEAWVYRQAAKWSFAVKLGRKVVRIQRAGLARWMAQRNRR